MRIVAEVEADQGISITWDPRPWEAQREAMSRVGGFTLPEEQGWSSEPDESLWKDPDTGYNCLARRGPSGAWCGYVEVAESHPCHGVDWAAYPVNELEVHGGVTWSKRIVEDGPWFIGFDCSHYMDISPAVPLLRGFPGMFPAVYRTLTYVREEVTSLAAQLAALR